MSEGFIYNHNKCVNCNACRAACKLENGWDIQPRMVYTFNSDAFHSLPLINISLACNHCKKPVCLEGCPVSAYSREPLTGAIYIDEKRCIGCKYCQWNCPYDAPKYNSEKRTIGKCNLCFLRLTDGYLPACTTACPTGALDYGELSVNESKNFPAWFPDKNISPAIIFTGKQTSKQLIIIPEHAFKQINEPSVDMDNARSGDWSLVTFSFLTTISVSTVISSLINGIFPDKILFLLIIMTAGLISLFHLGNRLRVWRVFSNILRSPLSREIALFSVYSATSLIAVFLQIPGLLIISSITGLILLVAIDTVYIYSDNRKSVLLHSGQTFLSALMIVSFFTGYLYPFLFVSSLKLSASVYSLNSSRIAGIQAVIRFIRIAILLIAGASFVSGISYPGTLIFSIFITGEFLDRILFYVDFSPLNIKTEITRQLNN